MTNVEALKKLYTDLGGSAAEVESCTTVSEVIPKLSEVAGGGSGGGADVYRIKVVYDEESEDVSYIADVPFFELEKTPAFAIVYDEEEGEEYPMFHVVNFTFQGFSFYPATTPYNFGINVMSPDGEDETGRVFVQTHYDANLDIATDDDDDIG